MKRIMLCILALVTGIGSATHAQIVSGTWQGTISAGRDLRIIVKITDDDGRLKGAMYSIDQGGQPIALSSVGLQGTTFTYAVASINGSYKGTLSADGNSIAGIWTQGDRPLPLNLVRATKDTAWEIPEPPKSMAADADPSFEVATIKPSKPEAQGKAFLLRGRTESTFNTTLADLIEFAYDMHAKQIVGGPDWIDKDKYDISGVPDKKGQPSYEQVKSMMQKLLADRFQLTFHHDKKELSVYVLSVAKNGPKNVTKSAATQPGFSIPISPAPGGIKLSVRNGTMTNFAVFGLQGAVLDRPVLDQTGLKDRFDFALIWMPDDSQFGGHMPIPPSDNSAPGLFTAIQEQLGLKLDAVKAPADVLVIDRAEKPSAN
jgi:uncharacterized protein (TIGR03435 family)